MSDFDQAVGQAGLAGEFPNPEPKRIKVFGVLHIVFGALGLLGLVAVLVMSAAQEALMKLATSGGSGMDEYTRISLEVTKKLNSMSLVGAVFGAILAVLLLISGISLVKIRAKGVVWSNRYAWASIALKFVALLLFFLVTKPMLDGILDPYMAEADGVLKTQLSMLKWSQAIGGVLSPFLMAIYPILALILLNRPVVKNFFAARGE